MALIPGHSAVESLMVGRGRASWEALFLEVFTPLLGWGAPQDGAIHLSGIRHSSSGLRSDGYEAFSRALFGFSLFYFRGQECRIPTPQGETDVLELFARGIAAGTDPADPNYWGLITARQCLVENGILAAALMLIGDPIWDRLNDQEQKNTLHWFEKSSGGNFCYNNWQFFRLFHCIFLEVYGGNVDAGSQRAALDAIERMYVGDGWYTDSFAGSEPKFDYYNPYVMHFFGLLFVMLAPESYRKLKDRYRDRARKFLNHYQYFFTPGAHQVVYGRSQLYNLAAVGIWGLALFLRCTDVDPAWIKGCTIDAVNSFLKHGAVKEDGLLSMGLYKDFAPMLENYSGPGSPYLNFEAFSFLLLPEKHGFWQIPPAKKPWRGIHRIGPANAMLVHDGSRGVGLYPAGTTDPGFTFKYDKFAYHNSFIFDYCPSCPADNSLVFRSRAGKWSTGRQISERRNSNKFVQSAWCPADVSDVFVISTIIPLPGGYKAVHIIDSPKQLRFIAGGFVLAGSHAGGLSNLSSRRAVYKRDGRTTAIELIRGPGRARTCKRKGVNPSGRCSIFPVLRGILPSGRNVLAYKAWCSDASGSDSW